jgi:hypothetical protein
MENEVSSDEFYTKAKGKTAQAAFNTARERAQWAHDHSGHTGTISPAIGFADWRMGRPVLGVLGRRRWLD